MRGVVHADADHRARTRDRRTDAELVGPLEGMVLETARYLAANLRASLALLEPSPGASEESFARAEELEGLGAEVRKMYPLFDCELSGVPVGERPGSVTAAQALFWMNNPLRYSGDTLYQSSWDPETEAGKALVEADPSAEAPQSDRLSDEPADPAEVAAAGKEFVAGLIDAMGLEQPHAGLALEHGELLRDGGRGVAERVGGGGDRPAGGELAKDAEAADVEHAEAQLTLRARNRNWC